jgi:NAD(P)-dependent dehydrogenase (short-subunit alcohol dehydrogenase family)
MKREDEMGQNVLITGAGSGFGKLTTEALLEAGHTVVASMRDPEDRNRGPAAGLKEQGAKIVEIDVTDDASVDTGVAEAIELTGGVDALVNNAGVGVLGLQESFTIDDWRRLFEINVFGVQRMNRALLPHLRDKNSGVLIHVSSLLGRFVLPFFGPYNASKHALEALAENYRVELSSFGVDSVIVEPGAYGTDFGSRLLLPGDTARNGSYGELAHAPAQQMEGFGEHFEGPNAPDPQMVADAIVRLVEAPAGKRPFRTVVDGLGMGVPIEKYNEAAQKTTRRIYTAFGMEKMLG